ncbi:DUF305 domain-containing protein [Dactylosporangium aurantiacum]|uniref:DUF305 domain-containing protein n=1 Tax=Dactylosporangium aurantiacum TaxID=35754 RepID=A0A9Q9I862_9ACTN|nr:DUF305 domain-containing protein [Dactylosporangium aurantiacum]MDG6108748.1 DUF305 domain-containing protein [Dactylosporangium aurantiacum]UWZ51107.1 DUF305 domain-containing protein [Dactylosporangium aurantiacum]
MRTINLRRAAVATGALSLALFAGGCAGHGADHSTMGTAAPTVAAPRSGATFNAADVTFATDMIPHHRQAIDMAEVAQAKAATPEVRALADRIAKAQEPEIATMSGWLTAWGAPVPSPGAMHHGMDGMGQMPGMMTDQEMRDLAKADGKAFDTMFLQMMIKHHQGAVEMARTEQAQGQDAAAKQLAARIAADQTAEITEMQGLLAKL